MNKYHNKERIIHATIMFSSLLLFTILFTAFIGFKEFSVVDENYQVEIDKANELHFSKESGFYDEPFYLSIEVPAGMKVYYTLNCSDPDENDILYTEPIFLENATKHPNIYSMRTDVSTGFYSDLIKKYHTIDKDPEYIAPDYYVPKCNIVRAVAVDKNHKKGKIITKTYFIGTEIKDFDGVNVVSITTDPRNLFDPEYGIYVTGKTFENAVKEGNLSSHWRFWPANYRQKGKEWERECVLSFFDKNGQLIYEQNDGCVRIQGGVSRGTVPRSLNVYAKTREGRNSVFNTKLFDSDYIASAVTFASGGNQLYTKLNDYMIALRCSNLNYATMEYKPYVLFLDGEYWGFYWMAEKYDVSYITYHYGVDKNNVLIIKNGQVECGKEDYKILYDNMLDELIDRDMEEQVNYEYACSVIDIESCIDYYATMAYIARQDDWPGYNFAVWRAVNVKDDQYSDGRWRWMMFDCNSVCMKKDIVNDNSIDYIISHDNLFESLWKNNEFKKKFKNRLFEIADNCFKSEEIDAFVDNYDQMMFPALKKSWERFHGKDNKKEEIYKEEMSGYKEFFKYRRGVVESWF